MYCSMQSKTVGWVLLIVGVVGAIWSYMSVWGMTWTVILIIIALIGAWMTFFRNDGGGQQQTPMQM